MGVCSALMESPPDDWFVMEQQRLSAFDQVYALPKDVLQAAIDAATGQLRALLLLHAAFAAGAAIGSAGAATGPAKLLQQQQQQQLNAAYPTLNPKPSLRLCVVAQTPRTVLSWVWWRAT